MYWAISRACSSVSAVPERCHRVVETALMHGDGVHIPLAEDQAGFPRRFCHVERKESPALFKYRGVGAVEIFGLPLPHDPAAEGDDEPRRSMIGKITRFRN